MRKLIYILGGILLISSCSTLKIEKLNSNSEIKKTGFVYNLPQTELNFQFKIIKERYFKGPFSDYSEEYLGFDNVIKKDEIKYKIKSININPILTNDTSQSYFVSGKSKHFKTYMFFDNTMVLSSINKDFDVLETKTDNQYIVNNIKSKNENYIPYKDITIRPLVVEKNDTIWKNILVDSVYKRVPKISKAIAPSTVKDQAYNASRFIFKIRKHRLRVLAGMEEKFPKGNALKKIVKELDDIENSYVELFTGKIISDTIFVSYKFVPNTTEKINEFILSFDEKNGFSDNANNQITIKISKSFENEILTNISNKEKTNNQFIYRIPENATVNIEYQNNIIYKTLVPVSQFGYLNYLNKNTFNKEVLFNKETGNIIYIK